MVALDFSRSVLGSNAALYQVNLLKLGWEERWDVVFLLDVLEHISQHVEAMIQLRKALRPGGLALVATPALQFFWSYNDEWGGHQRRYSRSDFAKLANECGLELILSRYFMFYLSPMLLLSRLRRPPAIDLSREQKREYLSRTHRVPPAPINQTLSLIFQSETPLGLWFPFPWGTSVLGVFRKAV